MVEDGLIERLRILFQNTVNQHHVAYQSTQGEDTEWPLWYANFLLADLGKELNATFTKSELVYLLVLAERQRQIEAPGSEWTIYYARFFAERYT